jgi:hypothetical protein
LATLGLIGRLPGRSGGVTSAAPGPIVACLAGNGGSAADASHVVCGLVEGRLVPLVSGAEGRAAE